MTITNIHNYAEPTSLAGQIELTDGVMNYMGCGWFVASQQDHTQGGKWQDVALSNFDVERLLASQDLQADLEEGGEAYFMGSDLWCLIQSPTGGAGGPQNVVLSTQDLATMQAVYNYAQAA